MKRILLAAGGTGGHLFSAIAIGEELTQRGFDAHLVTDERCRKYLSDDLKLTPHIIDFRVNYSSLITKIITAIKIFLALINSLFLLRRIKPGIIVGCGGYPAFPPMLAARILRIPIIVYEQNCFMGKSNKFFLNAANKIALAYKDTKNIGNIDAQKIIFSGDVVRAKISNMKEKKKFDNKQFRIFIFGGSQGAKIFSTLLPDTIKLLRKMGPAIDLYITQQAAKEDIASISKIYDELAIKHKLSDFFHNMDEIYHNSELVISRSGASTIAELTTIGQAAIFIPFPHAAENHQFYNAKSLEDIGAGWCFEQNMVTPKNLATKIHDLANNRDLLLKASKALLSRKTNGRMIIADTVEKIIS